MFGDAAQSCELAGQPLALSSDAPARKTGTLDVLKLARERQVVQALHARQLLRDDLPPLRVARQPIHHAMPRSSAVPVTGARH